MSADEVNEEVKFDEEKDESKDSVSFDLDPDAGDSTFLALDSKKSAYPWYVVHTYSGYEIRAKLTLEDRIKKHGFGDKFGHILVPQESVVEVVGGNKKASKKKFFPGYMLVQMKLDDDTWHLIKNIPKITGFVGDSRHPSPLSKKEVNTLMEQMQTGCKSPKSSVSFENGESVKVTSGPFADFNGTVDEVKPEKGKLRVLISIFGRNTPVELDFSQVEKV